MMFLHYLLLMCSMISASEYNLFGSPGQGYLMNVELGQPPQKLTLLVDTGSDSIAVASFNNSYSTKYFVYNESTTLIDTGKQVSAEYSVGKWNGRLVSDVIKMPSLPLEPVRSDMALITSFEDFFVKGSEWQGILGLAYPPVAPQTEDNSIIANTWLDAVDKTVGRRVTLQMKLCGITSTTNVSHYGSFEIIAEEDAKANKEFTHYTPILRETWYTIGMLSLRVLSPSDVNKVQNPEINETECLELNEKMCILDSGTTNIVLPEKVFKRVISQLRKFVPAQLDVPDNYWDSEREACSEEPVLWDQMPRLAIDLLSAEDKSQFFTIEIPPENYMHLVLYNAAKAWRPAQYCYKLGLQAGRATVLGVAGLEGFQLIFNRSAGKIGFQIADCGPNVRITGPFLTPYYLPDYCNLLKPLPKATAESIEVAQWTFFVILTVAMSLVTYLLAPTIRQKCTHRL